MTSRPSHPGCARASARRARARQPGPPRRRPRESDRHRAGRSRKSAVRRRQRRRCGSHSSVVVPSELNEHEDGRALGALKPVDSASCVSPQEARRASRSGGGDQGTDGVERLLGHVQLRAATREPRRMPNEPRASPRAPTALRQRVTRNAGNDRVGQVAPHPPWVTPRAPRSPRARRSRGQPVSASAEESAPNATCRRDPRTRAPARAACEEETPPLARGRAKAGASVEATGLPLLGHRRRGARRRALRPRRPPYAEQGHVRERPCSTAAATASAEKSSASADAVACHGPSPRPRGRAPALEPQHLESALNERRETAGRPPPSCAARPSRGSPPGGAATRRRLQPAGGIQPESGLGTA